MFVCQKAKMGVMFIDYFLKFMWSRKSHIHSIDYDDSLDCHYYYPFKITFLWFFFCNVCENFEILKLL